MPRALTITLPDELAKLIDEKIASGEYDDETDLVCDGLRALVGADDEIEQWLRKEVVPEYDRIKSGQSKLHTEAEVFDGMAERYLARKAAAGK